MAEVMEQVENSLVERLCIRNGWEISGNEDYDDAVREIKWFLSQPEILIKDSDQSFPDNVCEYDDGKDFTIGYKLAQQDMLKENWKKVLPK